jgi:hypothetical protein
MYIKMSHPRAQRISSLTINSGGNIQVSATAGLADPPLELGVEIDDTASGSDDLSSRGRTFIKKNGLSWTTTMMFPLRVLRWR